MSTAYKALISYMSPTRVQIQAVVAIIAVIQLTLLVTFMMHTLMIPPDSAKHLQFAMLVLEGKTPYKDTVDMVSPMILYLNLIPAYLSRLIHIHPIQVFNVFIWILSCLSQALSVLIVFKSKIREKYLYSCILVANSALQLYFIKEFGQTEHLLLLFIVPYWLCRCMRWSGKKPSQGLSMTSGILAGVGFSLNPVFVIFFLGIELCFWLEKQKFDAFTGGEFASCCAVQFIYVAHLIILPDAVAEYYLGWILPLSLIDLWQWDDRLLYVEKTPDRRDLIYFCVLTITAGLALSRKSKLIIPSLVFSMLGFATYLIQGQMFTFQAMPMVFGAVFCLVVLIALSTSLVPFFEKLPVPQLLCLTALIGCSFFLYKQYLPVSKSQRLSLKGQNYVGSAPRCDLSNLSEFVDQRTSPGDTVLVLNDRVRPAYPLLLQLGLKPAGALLDYAPNRIYDTYSLRDPDQAIKKFVYYDNLTWDSLSMTINTKTPKLVLLDGETVEPLMVKHTVRDLLNQVYPPPSYADWAENQDKHPKFEHLSFHFPVAAFTRKF